MVTGTTSGQIHQPWPHNIHDREGFVFHAKNTAGTRIVPPTSLQWINIFDGFLTFLLRWKDEGWVPTMEFTMSYRDRSFTVEFTKNDGPVGNATAQAAVL